LITTKVQACILVVIFGSRVCRVIVNCRIKDGFRRTQGVSVDNPA
jgi:hypothetical protein